MLVRWFRSGLTKKGVHGLGKDLKKQKTWEKGTKKAGNILTTGGKITKVLGVATGQPELILTGQSMQTGGKVSNKVLSDIKH